MAVGGSVTAPVKEVALLRARTVICTLGMHRSGTSLVSRMLNLLGVHLGPYPSVSGGGDDNPKGYWEHFAVGRLNDEILARFGGRWDEPPEFPPEWSRDPRLGDLREKARRIMAEDFAAEALWGWKDPRTCLTMPFWQDLVGSMRYVVCMRNPWAVIASLGCRSGMSPERAERLWLTHVQSSLAHTSGQPRMFIFYEDLMNDWRPELRRLATFIGRPRQADDPGVQALVDDFVKEDLYHHRMSALEVAESPDVSFASKACFLAMKALAPREPPADGASAEARDFEVQATLDILATRALEAWDIAAAASLREKRLLQEVGSLRGAARDRDAARATVREIQSSAAWTLVTWCRNVIVALLPAGTRRRRLLDAILRRLAGRPRPAAAREPTRSSG
jgi:hypothetical protein